MEVVDRQRICQNTFGFPIMTLLKALSDVSVSFLFQWSVPTHVSTYFKFEFICVLPMCLTWSIIVPLIIVPQLDLNPVLTLKRVGKQKKVRARDRSEVKGYERIRAQILLPRKSETITVQGQTNPMKNE
ncbi:hypothetical protein Tco_1444991 [Tanacetum coccineum]